MIGKMVILGSGGHAKSVLDAVQAAGLCEVVGFVGPDRNATYRGLCVVGGDGDLPALRASGVTSAAVGIGHLGGENYAREASIRSALDVGLSFPPVVDPSAIIAFDVQMGAGAFIGKLAVVNSTASVGEFSIVNSGAVIEHDCAVGPWAHVACNATLCGGASVGAGALVGAGATVLQGVSVGERAVVGAGSVVLADVPSATTVCGVYDGK